MKSGFFFLECSVQALSKTMIMHFWLLFVFFYTFYLNLPTRFWCTTHLLLNIYIMHIRVFGNVEFGISMLFLAFFPAAIHN